MKTKTQRIVGIYDRTEPEPGVPFALSDLKRVVLCQNCLNIEVDTPTLAKHCNEIMCFCGGDFCGCPSCRFDALVYILRGIPIPVMTDSFRKTLAAGL